MMTTTGGGTRPEAKAMNPTIASTPNWTFGAASGARRRVVVAISTHDAMTMAAQWRCTPPECAQECAQTGSEKHHSAANANQVPDKKRA
jgi:4-alpha-glucanotransferase